MSEGTIHYIILEHARVPLDVDFYTESFQAQRIHNYPEGSVQLRIYKSYVLVTPGAPSKWVLIKKCILNFVITC